VQAYLAYLFEIVRSLQKLSALIGALLASVWIGIRYRPRLHVQPWLIALLVLAGIALSFVCFPPAVYAYIKAPPPRTLSNAAFALTAFLLCAAFLTGCVLADRIHSIPRLQTGLIALALLLTSAASALTIQSVVQQRDTYIAFAQKWDMVNAQILQARAQGQPSVTIPAMTNWAGLDRPSDNRKFWATVCYSQYYGIQVYGPPY
jgi:hypothetical protein